MPIHDLRPESSLIIVKAESLRLRLRKKSKVTLQSCCIAQNVELFQEITYFCLIVCGLGSIVLLFFAPPRRSCFQLHPFFFFFLCVWLVGLPAALHQIYWTTERISTKIDERRVWDQIRPHFLVWIRVFFFSLSLKLRDKMFSSSFFDLSGNNTQILMKSYQPYLG